MNTKKWTFIDTFIVLVVLIVAIVGVVMLKPSIGVATERKKVELTVIIQNKDIELAQAITPGAKATLSLTEKDGGIVKDVRYETANQLTYNSIDGTYSNEEVPGKVDIYVTVEADCSISDKAIKTGGTAIKVGAEIPVRGKGFAANGFVIDIED